MSDILVAKIGGSTLGAHDTTVEDIVALQRRSVRPVVVHGGGALISEWLEAREVPTRFERGLRVTDERTLEVVVAVLAGLVNKRLVAALTAAGGRAVGLSGADGGLFKAPLLDERLGFVGEVAEVDTRPLLDLLDDGFVPVVAPIAVEWRGETVTGQLLNVNADTAAGAVAAALGARWLVFLTDVPGILGEDGQTVGALSPPRASALTKAGVIQGGMIPKVEACLRAAASGCRSVIVDGRRASALQGAIEDGKGTVVG
ncbi:MAG: acetylglutamate kinase [Actinobacteria bacterium RBG_13_63_9]|nr:MAG: acetylglutamate kinase [Actinobacteria bacterium RBG_13_63_9]